MKKHRKAQTFVIANIKMLIVEHMNKADENGRAVLTMLLDDINDKFSMKKE